MGSKGETTKNEAKEEEARKREEDARRLAQEAEGWLKHEEEEIKKKEDAEIKKKQEENEGQRLTGSQTDQQTTKQMDAQGAHDHTDQGHGQDNPNLQEPAAIFGITQEQVVFSGMNLIPFMQKEGEEVPDFSTIFYDKEKKRIVKRIEKKVETGQSSKMITDKTLVYGTDADPRLTGSKNDQQTTDLIDTQGAHDHTDQGHGQDNPDPQEPTATSGSTQEQVVFSGMNLIPFI